MMTVDVLSLQRGEQVKEGEIWTDGSGVFCSPPDSVLLQNIIQDGIRVGPDRTKVTKDTPEKFIKGLAEYYSGAMLRVTTVRRS